MDDSGWVYVVQCSDSGAVKIGWSTQPQRRVQDLQVASPSRLRLRMMVRGTRHCEQLLHARLWRLRLRGEWFAPASLPCIAVLLRQGKLFRPLAPFSPPYPAR